MKTDLTYLKNMSGGSPEIIKEMVNLFAEQVVEIAEQMHEALANKDWVNLGKLAHKAKSSVAIMGMNDLSAELKRLELIAGQGIETESYPAIVSKFNSDCSEAVIELQKYIETEN